MWRWSLKSDDFKIANAVFSTYVEVILAERVKTFNKKSILHVCGGDPGLYTVKEEKKEVFSTYVEVILN